MSRNIGFNSLSNDRNINYVSLDDNIVVQQEVVNEVHASGIISGLVVTHDTGTSIDITLGRVIFNISNEVFFFDIGTQIGLTLTINVVTYIYLNYNAGAPNYTLETSLSTDTDNKILVSKVSWDGIQFSQNSAHKQDATTFDSNVFLRNLEESTYKHVSGVLSSVSSLNANASAGVFYTGITRLTTPAFDTSGSDTFTYLYGSTGSFTEILVQSALNNTQYDNAGVLTSMTANYYKSDYFYLSSDGIATVIVGKTEYDNANDATNESEPGSSSKNPPILTSGIYFGKFVIQQGNGTVVSVVSVFVTAGGGAIGEDFWDRDVTNTAVYPQISGDSIVGGTSSGGDLALSSTSHATKGTINIDSGMLVTLGANDQVFIDGSTNPHINTAPFEVSMTAGIDNVSALGINTINSGGFGDVRGTTYLHDISADTATHRSVGLKYEFNIAGTENHEVDILSVSKVGTKEASTTLHAVHVGEEIGPIHQRVGVLTSIEQAWLYDDSLTSFFDATAAFNSTGTDVAMFVEDNDIVYLGKDATFNVAAFDLDTVASGGGISPVFEYWNGAWVTLPVTDNTNGMRFTGSIDWDTPGDWATTSVNAVVKYYFRITRTKNSLGTVPIENLVQYLGGTTYEWDENGDLDVNEIASTDIDIITGVTTSSHMHLGEIVGEGAYFTSTADDQLIMSGGAELVSGTWIARHTSASIISMGAGSVGFLTNTSLTDGVGFTPTERVLITAAGVLDVDVIDEHGAGNGVTIDGILLKDDTISPSTTDLSLQAIGTGFVNVLGNTTAGDASIILDRTAGSDISDVRFATATVTTFSLGLQLGAVDYQLLNNAVGSTSYTVSASTNDLTMTSDLKIDAIDERTTSAGVTIEGNLLKDSELTLGVGTNVGEFSIDGTLAGDSDSVVPTEKAVKTYVDAQVGGSISSDAFMARVLSTVTSVTGDNTIYTVAFGTEDFDDGANYDNSTFQYTVPTTGKYQVNVYMTILDVSTVNHTTMTSNIVASTAGSLTGFVIFTPPYSGEYHISYSAILTLTATETVHITLKVNGSSKVVDVALDSRFSMVRLY